MSTTNRMLLNFYGDDFTGSTDALETLSASGVRTMLFIQPPTKELLEEKFSDLQAFGIAGIGRSLGNREIEEELAPIFEVLRSNPAFVTHYKVCSTFDSSPEVGNIGKVIELSRKIYSRQKYIPVLAGSPSLKRYTLFGNHFASMKGKTFRIDRHPVMSRHPVTPMNEADLLLHLSKQTTKHSTGLIDIKDLEGTVTDIREKINHKVTNKEEVILFDVLTEKNIGTIGEVLWEDAAGENFFTIGSSGIEDAFISRWRRQGIIKEATFPAPDAVERLVAISGSCSEITKEQIQFSLEAGFEGVKVPPEIINTAKREKVLKKLTRQARDILARGQSMVFYTALGPDDPAIEESKSVSAASGFAEKEAGRILAEQLGSLCKKVVEENNVKRVLVAGGDTSGYVMKKMDITSIEMSYPLTRGVPLCKCHSDISSVNGLEIALKGGQMGDVDFFINVKNGGGKL